MKKILLCAFLLPCAAMHTGPHNGLPSSSNLVEVRSGTWPINMERDIEYRDTSYSLIFRNQEVLTDVVLDTLEFGNITQLRYFEKALTALKSGGNGDIAKFKDYSIKRTDSKLQPTSYLLRLKWSSTQFQQPEADLMRKTIEGL
ncbi:MAG: hypothetical protein Q8927_12820 [Bacteroidota bacterium]|nr:hypothetical protein [Bacteroidota bacterium]MDP4217076.1 hypothetical protein [Bacteroidota bacterium]MDP4244420.1 hypothetical protein [Bacteroidota bacterium]MDP4259799.1 hypothetical protein [Bacteroidota bacterium]